MRTTLEYMTRKCKHCGFVLGAHGRLNSECPEIDPGGNIIKTHFSERVRFEAVNDS